MGNEDRILIELSGIRTELTTLNSRVGNLEGKLSIMKVGFSSVWGAIAGAAVAYFKIKGG